MSTSKAPKILITAALPYANGPLHFGHIAGCYLPADCYARFMRLKGADVHFISGSDEFGVAITLSAEQAGRTPKEQVDLFHGVISDFFKTLQISFDHYSRTTRPGHVKTTQEFFKDLMANGHIEEKVTEQLYSEKEERFLADRYVLGTCPKCGFEEARGDECPKCGGNFEATDLKNPRSKMTGAALTLKETKHWFLQFGHFKDQLKTWLDKKDWKPNVKNFAMHYIDELRERAITRDSNWGIPLPIEGTEGKVFYVWFDAPIGYISSSREWAEQKGEPDAWKDYWCDEETKLVNFIGKDNIPFHAIFFPAMIMGQNAPYKIVDELPANEFYNLEGKQFSKSSGHTIDLDRFFKEFTADQARYAIAANSPETQDAEFTWDGFKMHCNSELLGKLGNFANRVLVFTQNKCGAVIPASDPDADFFAKIKELLSEISFAYEGFSLRKASKLIMELAAAGNVYFDSQKPWKAETDEEREKVIASCLLCLKALVLAMNPIMPNTSETLAKLIGLEGELEWTDGYLDQPLLAGKTLPKPKILFKRVEDDTVEKLRS